MVRRRWEVSAIVTESGDSRSVMIPVEMQIGAARSSLGASSDISEIANHHLQEDISNPY